MSSNPSLSEQSLSRAISCDLAPPSHASCGGRWWRQHARHSGRPSRSSSSCPTQPFTCAGQLRAASSAIEAGSEPLHFSGASWLHPRFRYGARGLEFLLSSEAPSRSGPLQRNPGQKRNLGPDFILHFLSDTLFSREKRRQNPPEPLFSW